MNLADAKELVEHAEAHLEIQVVAKELGVDLESLIPVRLVSHHMRLLGLMNATAEGDTLVLVDYDNTK